MKPGLIFSLTISICNYLLAQTPDSLSLDRPKTGNTLFGGFGSNAESIYRQNRMIVKGNVTFQTGHLKLTPIEAGIFDIESVECEAVLERDTATLKRIWMRDFILDEPQNELLIGKNPVPYYVFFTRVVERFNVIGNDVHTAGYESVQLLASNGKVADPFKRIFFHVWVMRSGGWRLSTNQVNKTQD